MRLGPSGWAARRPILALVLTYVALAALSLVLPSSPTYDPWTWLTWGREVTRLDLDTRGGGAAWKPLPVLFTTPLSLFGTLAPALWLVVARAGGLLAVAMAYRLASAAGGAVAGAVAGAALVTSAGFLDYLVPLGMSEPLLAALVLWAIERHLHGRLAHAYLLGFAGALLRPEVWPFLALYGLFVWMRNPKRRPMIVVTLLLLPVLWFGAELWGSGDLLRSARRAQQPTQGGPLLESVPALAVLRNARDYLIAPFQVAALVAVLAAAGAFAARRGLLLARGLTIVAAAWLALVALATQLRLQAGDARYLIVVASMGSVLAGIGAVVLGEAGGRALARLSRREHLAATGRVCTWLVLLAVTLPFLLARAEAWKDAAGELGYQAALYRKLPSAVRAAGGAESLRSCGRAFTGPYQVPAVAWHLDVHLSDVGLRPRPPGAVFRARATRRAAVEPPSLPERMGFRVVARVGVWEVAKACGASPTVGPAAD